ncbi:hypothetical protein [Massilia forsythiae]|uniref:hypothetical protein n=1 Tax=Massilia forsythiae TaxID=2728020 RepID=UPI001B7CF2E4|nr:hypothetical protein [Massilia forsythiae]
MTTEKATPPGIALDNEALDRLEALARAADAHGATHLVTHYRFEADAKAEEAWRRAATPATIRPLIAQARAAQPQPSAAPDGSLREAVKAITQLLNGREWADILHTDQDAIALWDALNVLVEDHNAAAAPSPNFAVRGAEPAVPSISRIAEAVSFLIGANVVDWVSSSDEENEPFSSDEHERAHLCEMIRKYVPVSDSGMQAAHQAAIELAGDTIDARNAEIADLRAQLSAARQGQADPVAYLTTDRKMLVFADRLVGNDHGMTALYAAPQPTAAPTPQAQPAGAAAALTDEEITEVASEFLLADFERMRDYDIALGRAVLEAQAKKAGAVAPTPHEQEARAAVPVIDAYTAPHDHPPLVEIAVRLAKENREWPGKQIEDAARAEYAEVLSAQAGMLPVAQTDAARDVLDERQRQVEKEGWTPEHDDMHDSGEMAHAAACYAVGDDKPGWPWARKWWKPGSRRRSLVKAGALILAEIERLDRAKGAAGLEGGAGGLHD